MSPELDALSIRIKDGEIIEYYGDETEIVVPSIFHGERITAIGETAFRGCEALICVSVEPGIQIIRNGAFAGCKNLKTVTLPDSIIKIGERGQGKQDQQIGAFAETSIEDIIIPNSVDTIGPAAFAKTALHAIVLPNSIREIGRGAFERCKNLEIVKLPEDLIALESYMFRGCSALAEIIFPDKLHYIKTGAFSGLSSVVKMELPYGLLELGASVFSGCKVLTDLYVPFTVVRINDSNCFGYLFSYSQSVFPAKATVHCHPQSFTRKYCDVHHNKVIDWEK